MTHKQFTERQLLSLMALAEEVFLEVANEDYQPDCPDLCAVAEYILLSVRN